MIAASPYLKIFLIEHYLNPCRYDYNIVFSRRLAGPIDIKKLELALEKTIKESVILNSHLYVDDETKIYWKENSNNSKFSYFKDISKKDTFIKTPFDLFKGPLYRFALFEIDKNTHDLVIILHHCLIDGGSFDVFISRVSSYYNGITIKQFSTLEKQREIIANSSNLLKKNINFLHEKKKGQKFWQRRLKDFNFGNTLPYIRSKESSKKVGIKKFKVNKTSLLQTMSSRLDFSYFNILSTIWGILVAKYCDSYESTMLFPISIRNIDKELYGAYINTLVDGIDISNNKSYDQLASEYKKAIEELKIDSNNKYSYYPIYDVIHALKAKETNVSFGQTNIKEKKFNFKQCKESINLEDEVDIAGSELYLGFEENANSFTFKLYYNTTLFKEYQIVEIIRCYENLLLKISSNPYEAITKIDLVDKETKDKLLYKWNNTDRVYPSNKTIHSLFEEQVVKSPNNIAVKYEDVKLTYKELNERANQLAHYLIKHHNIKPDSLITLLLDRSEYMIIAILAVLKAGAAYVPMDSKYPDDRIKYIISDTKADVVITNEIYNKKVNKINKKVRIIAIGGNIQKLDKYLTTNPIVDNLTSNNLSYIIYTSGITGKPKGVHIEHHSVVNIILYLNKNIYNKHKQNIAAFTSYTFDVSVSEFFCALISGNCLNILSNTTKKDALLISKYINEHSINYLYLPPVVLSQLPRVKYKTLDKIVYAGEPCDRNTALYWSTSCKLYNYYGPTEGTIYVTGKKIINDNVGSIGSPIANSKVYVLSSELLPLPIGAIGELYVSGVGLARGYLNKPDLTKERFIPNPFQTSDEKNKNARLYKTGDLVRWLSSGEIEYIGRNDFQVKIRGFRIELGEIESTLNEYKGVKQAVVLTRENKKTTNKYLVAYYTSRDGDKLNEEEIFSYLASKLPEYMIPIAIIHLDKLPLTLNGKLDRKALPDPVLSNVDRYVAPRNKLESKLCSIFSDVLGIEANKVGINDDFFRLGGDSIVSIQLVSRIRQNLNINYITIKDIFTYKTIAKLYDNIIKCKTGKPETIKLLSEQGILTGNMPLLPIQTWFFASKFEVPHHWNQAFIIKTRELNINILQKCIGELVGYHDAFRLRFSKNRAYYDNKATPEELKIIDVSTLNHKDELHSMLTELQSNFNLQKGPTYSIAYIHGFNDDSSRIFFALHHLIVDTVSWRILTQNLKDLYSQAINGEKLSLRNKLTSYRQWSVIVNNYNNKQEKAYWANITKGIADFNKAVRKLVTNNECSSNFSLSKRLTENLIKKANQTYHTQINDLLLTVLSLSLSETLSTNTNYITLEGHGRENSISKNNIDICNTLGWFTTMYPVELSTKDNIGDSIKHIKETLRQIPNNGIGYDAIEGYSKLPLIVFNYLGQLDQAGKEDEWSITGEDSGITISTKNKDRNIININGVVMDSKLSFNVSSKLENSLHDKLVKLFNKQLENVIKHCYENKYKCEYTISDFKTIESEGDLANLPMLINNNNWFEITEIQKSYLLGRLDNYEIGNVSNHIYMEYYYKKLDITKLERVLQKVIREIPILRSVFSYETLMQKFLPEVDEYKIKIHEYTTKFNLNNIEQVRKRLSHKVYNPEEYPLFTFEVSKFSDYIVLHVSIDMVLLDAQSRELFFNFINEYYKNELQQIDIAEVTFKDYQNYITLLKNSLWYKRDKAYWADKLASIPLRPELHFVKNPSSIKTPTFKEHTIFIEKRDWLAFKKQVEKHNLSYSSVLLSLYGSVISYYSGSSRLPITMTVFNRYGIHDRVNEILGDFTSTNLFTYENDNASFTQNLKRTHEEMWENISHIFYTGVEVQRDLAKLHKLDMSQAVSPIVFTGIVGNQSKATYSKYLEDNELLEKRYISAQTSQAWIDLQAIEVDDKFMSMWLHVEEIFEEGYISKLNNLYCNLIKHLAHSDWDSSTEIFAPIKEEQNIIAAANSAEQSITEDTLFSRYENIVKTKNLYKQTVVVDSQGEYPHEQLLNDSDKLAKYLYKKSQQPLIGILSEKSYNQVVSTLSIMQSGYGYLPLNVDWPVKRIGKILDEAKVDILLISAREYVQKAKELDKYNLIIIEDKLKEIAGISIKLSPIQADDVAYVIFTPGSTGKPKGVTITHRGALNTIDAVNNRFNISEKDRVLALSELSFDLSVYDIFGMLNVGGQIVFPDRDKTREPKHWLELIDKHKITIWNTVPQLADLLVNETKEAMNSLRLFLLSGDWISLNLPDNIKQSCPQACVMSLGGATEGSIWSIWYDVTDGKYDAIPYGVAMPNQKMYVLNKNLRDCPIGVMGDIYIGGVGVAANYWKREDLTEASFIEHDLYGRLYRTGDLGRWDESGYMEFMGRSDLQVKVNGHRVELKEIEAKLNALDGVEKTVVRVQEKDSKNYLVGYVVPSNQSIANLAHSDFDSQSFKLEQHGLIKDSKIDYQLAPLLNEKTYKLRKSYRKFNSRGVDIDLVTQTIKKLINKLKDKNINIEQKRPVTQESLTNLLGVISGLQLSGRVLPKYRYPSAGSSYSVRCFINIPKKVGSIKAGYYYYHPTQHGLYKMATEKDEELSLYLKAEWDAIKPLYGDNSEQFALQEAGHMLSLLLAEMETQGLGYEVACLKGPIVKVRIGGNKQFVGNPGDIPQITYLKREGFSYLNKSHSYKIEQEDILTQQQEMNQILLNGSYLLVQEVAKYTEISMLLSGLLYQRISETLYGYDIGSCILGLTPFNGAIYTIVLGGIDDQDKSYSESMIDIPSFTDILNEHLKISLPEYMLPGNYMLLRELPLTASGKVDTEQLRHLEFVGDTYIAPTTELEKQLCDIWQEILNIKRVGIKDDFFKLGGDSISAIKLISKINIEFKSSIKIKDIFEYNTVEGLCALITKSENDFVYKDFMIKEINQDKLYKPFAMNNVQQAYYLGRGGNFDLGNIGTHSYTESIYKELDVARLEVSLNKLIERHLSLRTIFTDKGQLHLAEVPYVKIVYYELTSFDELISIRNKLAHKVYDPGTFPIFDFVVSKLGSEYILHISIDALIMDAMSFTIFFKEWRCLYDDIEYKLPELKLSYRDYIIEHEKIRESKLFSQARKYWENKANLYQLDLKLPILKEAHEVKDATFARVTKTITNSIWNQVLEKALNLNISPTALLLCVYGKVLSYWSAQNKVTINLTLFNRLPLHAQIHDILGDFTVLELFNYNDSQTDSIKKMLSNCHDELLNDIDHNLFDGIDLQRLLRKKYGLLSNDIISPVVLTSILTGSKESQELLNPINDSYKGEQYSITQTPQVWLDNKGYNTVDGFVAEWDYVEELFAKDTIEAMHYAYCDLIEELAKLDWDKDKFPSIKLPSKDSAIIEKANNSIQAISGDTLYGRCEQMVKAHKLQKEIAVIENNQSYSYETLLDDATKLAKYLFSNCKDQELIAVLCEKGYFQILATFGIMKAGFGYLPLNIEWPSERIAEILDQAGVSTIVLTSSQAKVMSLSRQL